MRLNLDERIIKSLRELINSSPVFYYAPEHKEHWDLVCAFMDRIEDSIRELNSLNLNSDKTWNQNEIILFFVYAGIINSCVDVLCDELEVIDIYESKYDIFGMKGIDGTGTDNKYFMFLRNLSFAHVIDVNRRSPYILAQRNEILRAPIISGDGHKIVITVYSNIPERKTSSISPIVKKEQLFKYLIRRYKLLENIKAYYNNCLCTYSQTWNNQIVDEGDIISQLNQMKTYMSSRYDTYTLNHIDEIIRVLEYDSSIEKNNTYVRVYQDYIKEKAKKFINDFNDKTREIENHEFYYVQDFNSKFEHPNANWILEKIRVHLSEIELNSDQFDLTIQDSINSKNANVEIGLKALELFKKSFSDDFLQIELDMPFAEIQILVNVALFIK
ncbi:MAG: hypothetical protein KGZ51_03185 [Erysipelothrix sp.]|nr:hypothetical protein [Erysipelothrix sp.]